MGNGSGLSRGDRNRNARLARLRELVPLSNAIVGIDLADDTQAVVVTDHDSRGDRPAPGQRPGVGAGRGTGLGGDAGGRGGVSRR